MSIREALKHYPRARLMAGPTPIHRLPRLSEHLDVEVFIMRDDLTGFAAGGNKVRKLDYILADASAKQADTLVATGACSFTRNAAAAARVLGFEFHLQVFGERDDQNPASLAFFEEFGARLHFIPVERENELPALKADLIEELTRSGRRTYELHPGGSDSIGTLGYIDAFRQIAEFPDAHFDRIYLPTGSTATQAGLVLGQCLCSYESSIIGVAVSQPREIQRERVWRLTAATAHMLSTSVTKDRILIDDRYLGPGYPIPSEAGRAAVSLFAGLEGVMLDQIYTGKAAAALIGNAKEGSLSRGETVLFLHTGGNSGLYY